MATDYAPPLDRFLTLGRPEIANAAHWPNYVQEYGLGPEHIPELIRLATDHDLRWDEDEENVASHAPIYAWRALGQLRAEEAITPLVGLWDEEEDEWAGEELPEVFAMIGPSALPALIAYLADVERNVWGRGHALAGLEAMAEQCPETRDEVIAAIRRQMEAFQENDPTLNGFLIASLMRYKVADAVPFIEQAFEADLVDSLFIGWDDVAEEFGLIPPEEIERRRVARLEASYLPPPRPPAAAVLTPGAKTVSPRGEPTKAKAKRKMAKASRQKNRKRK